MKMQIIDTSCYRRRLELEQVRNYFEGNGYDLVQEDFEVDPSADVIFLSTCGFTQAAEDFGLRTLERIEQNRRRDCTLIVGGCLPKINPDSLASYSTVDPRNYNRLDHFFQMDIPFQEFPRPNTLRDWKLHAAYREHGLMKTDESQLDEVALATKKDNIRAVVGINKEINKNLTDKTAGFRVQCVEGCACHCTYCAIKLAIGKSTSRPVKEIMEEIRGGIDEGYKRIYLEGDSLGGYGLDIGSNLGVLLDEVIVAVANTDVEVNITDISPMFLKYCVNQVITLGQMNKLFNFYIPIQSGSQRILNRMRRGYDIEATKKLIQQIKNNCSIRIGTSIIIGFPGETMDDLKLTIDMCKELGFNYVFTHSFSARSGTEAFHMPDQLSGEEILRRSRLFKDALRDCTEFITIAEDTKGNRTCQG
ncbi:radical SAM protein [Paenibacillus sp. YN15]|uniref:radical SAM protein n=1 Tax=Paenibacillus sp. YN15 TaxID=1742774 RepID=UPI0015EB59C8|nr:radical SAM protein [Paenibacillus sp. YN15]